MSSINLPQLADVKEARSLISEFVHETPILHSSHLNTQFNCTNFFKAELFQKTGSFKVRGALNKMLHLSDKEKGSGVIAVSLGNHAQAVAWAAKTLGIKATVFMPVNSQKVKIAAARDYGAHLILSGESAVETFAQFEDFQNTHHLTLIHPFNDFHVIAGAGTVALEIIEQIPEIDNVFVSVGGGGLLAGTAVVLKTLSPQTKIVGVEPFGANALFQSLQSQKLCHLDAVNTIADVLAVPYTGDLNYQIAKQLVDQVICVSDDEIKAAMKLILERCKLLIEPGGAAALAAITSGKYKTSSQARNVFILSGGNVDLQILATL